jgi:hypothetical protein
MFIGKENKSRTESMMNDLNPRLINVDHCFSLQSFLFSHDLNLHRFIVPSMHVKKIRIKYVQRTEIRKREFFCSDLRHFRGSYNSYIRVSFQKNGFERASERRRIVPRNKHHHRSVGIHPFTLVVDS